MKRKELEEFKKRWEENLGGLGEMLNSPWFAVSIKYDEAEKNMIVRKNPVSAFQGIKLRP